MIVRLFRHLLFPDWWLRRYLPDAALSRIADEVAAAEVGHSGEIRVAVEGSLDLLPLLHAVSARDRAVDVFAVQRVWDTEENNGILLYVLLADRDVEIVVDRGIAKQVPPSEWEAICQEMEALFRQGRQEEALALGVRRVGARLAALYGDSTKTANQLPDRPSLL